MKPLLFDLSEIFNLYEGEKAEYVLRAFPDGETYIRILSAVKDRKIIIVQSLDNPNAKLVPLMLLAKMLRDQGAAQITLLAPYLAYMRQDKIFHPGEGIAAKYIAELLSPHFDRLITVDPHLHRIKSLAEMYSLESTVLHATKEIAGYIQKNIKNPLIIGPDSESRQWAKEIADSLHAPLVIAEKKRRGDYEVDVEIPGVESYKEQVPVLVDDIISTAQTMIKAITYLKKFHAISPVCIGVHGVFAENAYEDLRAAGPSNVITCNTIKHRTNQIDLCELMARAF